MALSHQGRYDEAILQYREFLQQQPDSFRAHNNMGALLLARRNDDEAIGHFTEALRLNWNYLGAHMNLAMALMDQGAIYEAILHYEEAVRINPNDRTARQALKKAKEILAKQSKPDK
jgi:tetratricopeptide (TPR) repeat protein